jgi:hypothetical protein
MGYSESYFLSMHEGQPELPLRKKNCGECPVIEGMYTDISDSLKECSPETQLFVSKRWFCHCNRKYACRGNADNLGLVWKKP